MNGQRRDEDAMNRFWPVILTAATLITQGAVYAILKRWMMKIINQIEAESGQPFEEIVRLYAKELQVTMSEASILLGYSSHSPFIRLCRKRGWDKWFDGNKPRKAEREYSSEHNMGSPAAYEIEYDGVINSMLGHARRLGIPRNTVYGRNRRRPGDWEYVFRKVKHNSQRRVVKPAVWARR